MPKNKEINRNALIESALELAALRGWASVSLDDVAAHAGVAHEELKTYFDTKADIILALGKMVDEQTLLELGEGGASFDPDLEVRDQLFDVLMVRFDILNGYRAGILAILKSLCSDPSQAIVNLPHLACSMRVMLDAAGEDTQGVRGAVKIAGLTGVYLKVLRVWQEDESEDMAKVMAALDKDLGQGQQILDFLAL